MKQMTKETLSIYWQHMRKYRLVLFLMLVGILGSTLSSIYEPFLYKKLFDTLSLGDIKLVSQLISIIWLVLLVNLVTWFFWRLSVFSNNYFQPRVMADLLNSCFSYLHQHSYGFFANKFTGSLVRRVNRFVRSFEIITDQLYWNLSRTVLRVLFILIVLYFSHWVLSLIIFIWMIIFTAINFWFARFKFKYDTASAEIDSKISAHLADTIANNINLKLFGGSSREFESHKKITEESFRMRKFSWDLGGISEAVQAFLTIILEIVILYAAVKFWQRGILTIGDFVLIQTYLTQIFMHLWDFHRFLRHIYEGLAEAEEMTEMLKTPHGVKDMPGARKLRVKRGGIEFRGVFFAYQKSGKILTDFNLKIAPGERVALIGPSGGGKTTIVKLLFRFYEIAEGEIFIDGQDIKKVTQESLRANIALVPQDPWLFHRMLLENIGYAKPLATQEEIIKAAKLAHAHEFIKKLPYQYETYVGERGIKLSGGERQRVAIARAILMKAPILVLDEATSSLDSESEYFIQDALKKLMRGKTTIVIAHRLSTIMQMDRIIVIDEGKIIEEGKHEELLKINKGIYQKLWGIQAGGFVV